VLVTTLLLPPCWNVCRSTPGYRLQKSAPTGGGLLHVTDAVASCPVPNWLEALTPYDAGPSVALDAVHVDVLELQFDQR
jgi:hypothetical protein